MWHRRSPGPQRARRLTPDGFVLQPLPAGLSEPRRLAREAAPADAHLPPPPRLHAALPRADARLFATVTSAQRPRLFKDPNVPPMRSSKSKPTADQKRGTASLLIKTSAVTRRAPFAPSRRSPSATYLRPRDLFRR